MFDLFTKMNRNIYKNAIFLVVLVTITQFARVSYADRSLQSWVNWNCTSAECNRTDSNSTDWNLMYTLSRPGNKSSKSDLNNDLHFFTTTKGGFPGFLVIEAPTQANMSLDWDLLVKSEPNAIKIVGDEGPSARNTIGLLLSELFVWNDTNHNGNIDKDEPIQLIPLEQLLWSNVTDAQSSDQTSYASYKLKPTQSVSVLNGDLEINARIDSHTRHYDRLPRLYYSPKCMHIEIVLNNVTFNVPWNATRIGMELTLVNYAVSEPQNEGFDSIDDEYSPGIFRVRLVSFDF